MKTHFWLPIFGWFTATAWPFIKSSLLAVVNMYKKYVSFDGYESRENFVLAGVGLFLITDICSLVLSLLQHFFGPQIADSIIIVLIFGSLMPIFALIARRCRDGGISLWCYLFFGALWQYLISASNEHNILLPGMFECLPSLLLFLPSQKHFVECAADSENALNTESAVLPLWVSFKLAMSSFVRMYTNAYSSAIFRGRESRQSFCLSLFVLYTILNLLDWLCNKNGNGLLAIITLGIATCSVLPVVSSFVRRLRDGGTSPWFVVVWLLWAVACFFFADELDSYLRLFTPFLVLPLLFPSKNM